MKTQRRLVLLAVSLALLTAGWSGHASDGIGLFGDVIEWMSGFGSVPTVVLTRVPAEELTNAPQGEDVWFGAVELGTGSDTIYGIAVRREPKPLLWIDANNNEDLSDDGGGVRASSCDLGVCIWYPAVRVDYRDGAGERSEDYILRVLIELGCDEPKVHYASHCLRTGLLAAGERIVRLWIGDGDSDGRYDDVEDLTVIVDNDEDGAIDIDWASPEIFYPIDMFFPRGTIQIGDSLYEVEEASADGRRMSVVPSHAGLEPLCSLEVGSPAPAFETHTLDGKVVSSVALRGTAIVLHFAMLEVAFQGAFSCSDLSGTVVSEMTARTEQRLQELALLACEEDVRVFVVAYGEGPPSGERVAELDLPFPVIWDPDLTQLYRGIPLVVIGADGRIVARDEGGFTYDADGHIQSMEWNSLHASEIARLLETP